MKRLITLFTIVITVLNIQNLKAQIHENHWWQTNGEVRAIAKDTINNLVYLGGNFTHVGPNVPFGAQIDAGTGSPNINFANPNNTVRASIPDGSGGWYIGGDFTMVGDSSRNRIAHINSIGQVTSWNPNSNSTIRALGIIGSTIYAGGDFTNIGGQVRNRIVAIDAITGAVTAWNPNSNNTVYSIFVNGSIIYAGGAFTTIGGQTRNSIVALDATTGLATVWNPNASFAFPPTIVYTIIASGTTVYAGGNFTTIGGQARNRIAALSASTGLATAWNPNSSSTVLSLAISSSGTSVYAGGAFLNIGGQARNRIAELDATTGLATTWNPNADNVVNSISISGTNVYVGGLFLTIGGQARNRIATIDVTSGIATAWDPNASDVVNNVNASGSTIYVGGAYTSIGGKTRNSIAALDATTGEVTSWNPNSNNIVRALVVSGNIIYAGGLFTTIGGQTRNKIAALDASTGLATTWNPNTTGNVFALAKSGNRIYVGGSFTNIGGAARNSIAALDSTTGVASSWNPNSNSNVFALAVSGNTVYAGGDFTTISALARARVAALSVTTGVADAWSPNANNSVYAIAISGNTVYIGGLFTGVAAGAITRNRIAAYGPSGLLAWNPNADNTVFSVSASRGSVYVGGIFTTIGGQTRNSLAALDQNTGLASSWNPNLNNIVYTLANHVDTLYSGGTFTSVGARPRNCFAVFSFPCTSPAITSQPVAQSLCQGATATFTVAANGTNISYQWKKNGSNIGTNSPTLTIGSVTPTNTGIYEVVITGNCGNITSNTVSLTVNATPTISVNSGNVCSGSSFTITPSGASTYTIQGGTAIKTPTANTTYTVTGTSTAGCVSSTFATSSVTVVAPPTIIVSGGSICSGSSYTIVPSGASTYTFSGGSVVSPTVNTTYTVTGTDVNGCVNSIGSTLLVSINPPITNLSVVASSTNICTGQSATVSVASSQTDIKYYLRDDATNNVVVGPVNGTGGTLSFNTGTLTSNTTYNVYAETQSLGNKGLDFDGTNDVITTNITSSTTSSLTIEAWIFPRGTVAKRIVSSYFNNAAQSGEIILDTYNATNNGRGLRLAVEGAGNTLAQLSIANVLTLNAWNHVAGTFNSGVMTLYVNGVAVTNNSVVPAPFTSIPSCTNSITIGEDPTIGALEYFNGKMDEVRIWNTTRTQAQIAGNMNNCLIGNESGLKNYFKFSEGVGSTVTDLVTGSTGNMSGMTPATAWVTGNVDCGGSICNHEMTQLVTINVNATPTISVNSGSICSGNNFTLTPSGASTYTIQGGGAVKTPTANTTYTVTGTSAAGCISSTFATSSVTVNTTPTISVNSGSICAGNNFTISPSGASTYTIQGGSAIKTPTATTTYTVAGTGTNGCVSSNFATSTVTVNALPVISVPSTTICAGSTATLTASGANTYTWNTGSNTSFITASPASNTTYTVNGTSLQGCLGNIVTASITVGSAPSIALNNASVCAGSSATLIASGVSSYTWNTGATTNSIVVSPTVNTTYSVSGHLVGCTNSASNVSNVTVNSLPTIAVNSGSICAGNSFTITPSGANTYTIQGGSAIKTPTSNATYTVIGTSAAGCISSSFSTSSVTVNATPTISVNSGSICAGNNFTITPSGANTYTIQGGSSIVNPTANATYTVAGTGANGCVSNTFATSNVTVNAIPTITVNSGSICEGESYTITPNGANTYTIQGGNAIVNPTSNATYTVIGTSANGCISSSFATANVTVNAAPTIIVNSGSICEGESFTITPSGANTYTFSNGNIVNPMVSSNYTVTGTGTNGCINSIGSVSSVTVNSTPTITASNGAICPGSSFTLSPSGASTYTYSSGSAVVSPTNTSTYSISGTSAAGCVTNTPAIVTVTVSNTLNVVINGSNTICNGQTLNLTAGGAATYTWNTGATSSTIAPTPTSSTTYSVIGASGTCSNTAVITVTVNSLPSITAVSNETLLCVGSTASLTANGASTYTWNPGGTGAIIAVTPSVTTTYTVTGTDINGCENNSMITQDVSMCTGIKNITNNDNAMTLFPNPSSNNITIQTTESIKAVYIFNTLGDLVRTENTNIFSVEQLASGIYMIHVKTEKGINTLRFIRE